MSKLWSLCEWTRDDESTEEEKEEEKEPESDPYQIVNGKFMAFMARSLSNNDSDENNDDDEVSDKEKDWEGMYHSTFNEW